MSLLKLKTGAPSPVTAREFFDDICPKVLGLQSDACHKLGGTYGFAIFGDEGGNWSLDYASASVTMGNAASADLYVEMDAKDFGDLLRGALDVEASATAGRVRFSGDVSLLPNLTALFEPLA